MAEGHQRRSVSPKPQSRPTSPEVSPGQQAEGRRSRRPSMLPMSDSPTAVPLHFRRPPVPPGVNRPPSASSPAAPPPESPTQPRHRRPASTEFKNSREFRPLWLVERHGSAKNEPQPDEPLPSLPSSKTSSRSPSIEDLKGSGYDQDVRSWEAVDLSQHIHEGRRSPGLRISTGRDNHAEAEHDILGSQQATPTAETFGEATQPVNKEKPKYEFHSPSELLQDPSMYAELPPSPKLGALPSAEGSTVGVAEENTENNHPESNLRSLPSPHASRPSTPREERDSTPVVETTQADTHEESKTATDIAKGVGFAGIVDAAVSAAVKGDDNTPGRGVIDESGHAEFTGNIPESDNTVTQEVEPIRLERRLPEDSEAEPQSTDPPEAARPFSPSRDKTSADSAGVSEAAITAEANSKGDKGADLADTTQPEHAAELKGVPSDVADQKKDLNELSAAEKAPPAEAADKSLGQPQEKPVEEPAVESASASSSKKKKKNKKKGQSVDLAEPESTPAIDLPASEHNGKPEELSIEQEPTAMAAEIEQQPSSEFEASKSLEPEPVQPGEAQPEEAPPADVGEPPAPAVSSKKAKRDKKKGKSKVPESEERPEEPSGVEAPQPTAEAGTEHDGTQSTAEPENAAVEAPESGENVRTQIEESAAHARDEPVEPTEEVTGTSEELAQPTGQDRTAPTEETRELDGQLPVSGTDQEPGQVEAQEGAQETDGAKSPVEWQEPLEYPSADPRELPGESGETTISDAPKKDIAEVSAESETLVPESERTQFDVNQETVQETPAPAEESAPTEVVPESPAPDQGPPAAENEPEPAISRKASKKNKKKNKRKNTPDAPVESEVAEVKEPPSGEEKPDGQSERGIMSEAPLESEQPQVQHDQAEQPIQDLPKQDDPALETAPGEQQPDSTPADTTRDVTSEPQETGAMEEWEDQPKKKGKKGKKNRKSTSLSEAQPEPEPEPKPEQLEFVDAPEIQPPHASDEVPIVGENESTPEAKNDEAAATEGAVTTEAEEKEPTPLEEQPEIKNNEVATPEGVEPAATETEKEPISLEKHSETNDDRTSMQPSTAEGISAYTEAKEVPVENEAPKDTTAEVLESQTPAPVDIPLTPAQKKKAKKDKKKKRQSASVEETPVSEPAGESAQNEAVSEGDAALTEQPAVVQEPEDTQTSMGEASVMDPAKNAEEAPKEEPTRDGSTDAQTDTNATPEAPQDSSLDSAGPAVGPAPDIEESKIEETPAREEAENKVTKEGEETGSSAAIGLYSEQEPKYDSSPAGDLTSMDGTQAIASEPEPQTEETTTAGATTEGLAPDDRATAEDSQEPIEGAGTVAADGASQEQDQSQAEEAQTMTSKKSKKDKKKKKKRQSQTFEDEPTEKTAVSGEAETVEPSSEKEVSAEAEKSEDVPPQETAPEAAPVESADPAPTEEVQSTTSKKAKKDKKKRKSVSFDIEEPAAEPSDPNESKEGASEATPPADEAKPDDTATQGELVVSNVGGISSQEPEESQQSIDSRKEVPSVATGEHGEDNQPAEFASLADKVTGLDYEPTLEATETPATVPSESEIQSPSGEEKADDNAPVESEKTEATGAVQEADIVKGVEADSGGEPVASEDLSTADPQSANPDDGEQVPDFPKSKKDKKKKKKRNTSDLNEEAPTVITESPGATPEEAFRSTELEPANIQEPQETGQQPETQEVKEAARQPEKQEEEDKPLMSAKEKRKAKKDKKRKSKLSETDSDGQNGTASTPETPVLEESKDLSAPVNSAATENASQEAPATETGALDSSPATVVPPAEDDGKHNQSHDTQTSDEKEKDRIWTDETMSSQVEQQQTTSSDYPPQPAPEHTASDPISVPSGNDPDYSAPNTANEEGLSTSRSEPEASFEDKLLSDISETANEKSADLKQGEEAGNMDSKPEQIEEIPERDNIPSEPKEETTEQPATEESRAKESGSPAIPSAGTEEAFEDNSKLETPPAPEEEDWGMTASSKKKKKKKQKQREEQLRRNQLDAPENKEQEKGDFPVIEKPTTTPEYSSSEPGQMRVETALEPAETEAPKEPVTASEEPTLESGQKDDEPATEVAAEPQAPKELSEPSEDVTTNAEDVEMPGLPRKLTKKEKKKKRRSLAEEATSNTPEGDTSASTVPDNATAPAPSDSHEQNPAVDSDTNKHTLPEEQESGVKEAAEAETVREAPTSPAIDEQNKPELGVSHTRDVGNIQEEPTAAGDAIDPKQSPVEVAEEPRQPELDTNEATREVLEEPEDSWSTTSKKKNKKNKKKARTQEASAGEPAQVEEATATIEPTVEAPEAGEKSSREMPSNENVPEQPSEEKKDNVEDDSWTMPLTKKGKKAKKEKQARALEAEVPGFVETQEGANVDDGTAIANEHTNAPPVETLAMASEEQTREVEQTQQGPSISLDPFDVPLEPEALDVDKTTESADMHKLIEPGPESEPDPEGKEGAQKKLQLEALEKKDDLEAAQGLFQDSLKEPEVEAPLSRKLSKKDKRKSKQKALQSAIESTEQPEPEAPKEPEGSREITEDPMMSVVEQQDDAPLSRASSKKKKKKAKKDSQLMEREQPEEPEQEAGEPRPVTLAEHPEDVPADKFRRQQPQQDEEAWPTIDWGNDKGVNPVEEPPQPSSVSQQDPLGPGMESIGEFDESAIPWAVGKESEEPPAEDTWFTASKKKDKKKKKSQQKGVDLPSPTPADGMKDKSIEGSVLQSGKDNAEEETIDQGANRDNAMQVSEAPIATIEDNNYEAGSWPAPDNRSPRGNQSTSTAPTAPDPLQPTTREIDVSSATGPSHNVPVFPEGPGNENTSATVQLKDNDNDSTPSTHPASDPRTPSDSTCRLRRSQSIHGKHNHPPRPWSLDETTETTVETARATSAPQSLFGGPVGANADAISPPRTPLGTIAEQEPENHVGKTGGTMAPRSGTGQLEVKPEHLLPHPQTPVRKFTDNALDRQKWPTPDKDRGMEMGMEDESDELQKRRTDSPSVTPSERGLPPGPILTPSSHEKRALRRTTSRVSGDLRATSRAQEISETEDSQPLPPPARTPPPPDLNIEHIASSSSYDPVTDKGKRPLRGMTDVYVSIVSF
ncbi:hypothetical protein PHISCL_01395 [Aspergillus sclerotialis]|uniref:Involucrin repeat protein n=1 Tax=Aspergillus sclerotialis TaxID=2070753 RepID=A0A3A2ZY03_9EURO|nr:hypothetical protein PHISCL_01395 [Aspergillus sclerotialis]